MDNINEKQLKNFKKAAKAVLVLTGHDIMKAAQSVGGVSDAEMKEFEADCFAEEPVTTRNTESFNEMRYSSEAVV